MALLWKTHTRKAILAQRVADGEASAGDLKSFEHLADQDPDLRPDLDAARRLSAELRAVLVDRAPPVDFRAMQARVFQATSLPGRAPLVESLQVLLREWVWHRQEVLAPLTAGALALALAVVVPALVPAPSALPAELAAGAGTEIHSLDTDASTAVVFQEPASGLTVIFLADAEDAEEAGEAEESEGAVEDGLDVPEEVEAETHSEDETATP